MSHLPFGKSLSRRALLKSVSFSPLVFLPAPFRLFVSDLSGRAEFPFTDYRVVPHYPTKSPLEDMISLVMPGTDQFISEKYAFEIEEKLKSMAEELRRGTANADGLKQFFDAQIRGSDFGSADESAIRDRYGISVNTRKYKNGTELGGEAFLLSFRNRLASLPSLITAEFQITSIQQETSSPLSVAAGIRYALVGRARGGEREQRVGTWHTEWVQREGTWRAVQWLANEEVISRAKHPLFADVSAQAFANADSYRQQMRHGADYWRTVLDGASGIDVYGNQGIAVGDFDGDGFDDIYVCQPSGLPNRLYRNRGDGTFEDVTARAGLDVLDATSCALFADFENRGQQDLLVVTSGGPLLFVNDGAGRFSLRRDTFKFARPPQGTFTHAAVADYDRDGRLDIYFCLYNYYAGLAQYRYPSPYFDARNGPPNFLFHNEGNWNFTDRTQAAGLNAENDRYSFACAWGDHNGNGWPDLYVANDFGRSNLYRNNGDGTFTPISKEANVEDVGAGMSACWLDSDGDGRQDIYVANMWSAAGLRVSSQGDFHTADKEDVRAMYRRHARGNSLYKNLGDGTFRNVAAETNTEFGRWAWSSDSWDFDHDGSADIYVVNGYISGAEQVDLSSFFWRQVIGNSPAQLAPASKYEQGWNAINELIRSDRSWSGYERNVCYCNRGDGTFTDVSGISGLDIREDSRAFALADLDHDGRLEVILKNRTAPQLRILRNQMTAIGNSVAFRLSGTKSNRDAIGATVTVETAAQRQTKYLQAGSGFLSQHTKELTFGVGDFSGVIKAVIRWPSGVTQVLEQVPVNHRIEVTEGASGFRASAFAAGAWNRAQPLSEPAVAPLRDVLPDTLETWLLQPLRAPAFSLLDYSGKTWDLHSTPGNKLLALCATGSPTSQAQLRSLAKYKVNLAALTILAVVVDDPAEKDAMRSFVGSEAHPFPLLISTPEVTGTYNIVFRYLFDRHRDLEVPTSFLIDNDGMIVKIYQGVVGPERIAADMHRLPHTSAERKEQGLPFPGTLHVGDFQRNDFTYGVAFFQHGYLEAASDAFQQVIASKPDDAEANYNLGTLYLRRKDIPAARVYLEKTVQLKPTHAEAWNNLGMVTAQEGRTSEAIQDFKQCLALRPDYVTGLLNLGNLYRREKQFAEAEPLLSRALQLEPDNPEVNYSVGMMYAQQGQTDKAEQSFKDAIQLRPDYADALNNLGVLLVQEHRYADAEEKFRSCVRSNPNFDQAYLNLARLYVLLNEKQKARDVLESLLRVKPEHSIAQQALKVLQ
jgi:Flp pilus assembly protein TadD/peroxiredoxin